MCGLMRYVIGVGWLLLLYCFIDGKERYKEDSVEHRE